MRKIYASEILQTEETFILVSFIRTIIMYLIVIFVMRLMGKRQIGQLQPYEFVIALMISDSAVVWDRSDFIAAAAAAFYLVRGIKAENRTRLFLREAMRYD